MDMQAELDTRPTGRAASRLTRVVWWGIGIVALALICRTISLVCDLVRPMPYWDAWEFMKALPAIFAGRYGLADLLGFHNEHRIVTTRLIMLADVRFFAATGYLSTALTVGVLCVIGATLSLVAVGRDRVGVAVGLVVTSLLFSVAHADNFASGFQVQFPLVDLFAMASIGFFVLANTRAPPSVFLALTIMADALAIGTMASGNTVIAPVLLVALAMRTSLKRTAIVVIPGLILSAAYIVGYPKPSIPASHDPIGILHFAANYLGSSLRGYPGASLALGLGLLAIYVTIVADLLRRWMRRDRLDPVVVWLVAIGAFIIGGALVTGVGRLGLGLESSISSRYAIQSLLFVGSLLLIGWRMVQGLPVAAEARLGLATAGLAISLASSLAASPLREWQARVAAYDVAGTAFAEGVFSDDVVKGVYPFPELIRPALTFMQDHRLGPFSSRYADLYRPPLNALGSRGLDTLPTCEGHLDSSDAVGPGWTEIRGWAFEREHPEDNGWIVAFDDGRRVIGFARQTVDRPDVADAYHLGRASVGYLLELKLAQDSPDAHADITLVLIPDETRGSACRMVSRLVPE